MLLPSIALESSCSGKNCKHAVSFEPVKEVNESIQSKEYHNSITFFRIRFLALLREDEFKNTNKGSILAELQQMMNRIKPLSKVMYQYISHCVQSFFQFDTIKKIYTGLTESNIPIIIDHK